MSDLGIKFITRNSCVLCDQAWPIVEKFALKKGIDVERIDVDSSETLVREYGDRVPVVLGPSGVVMAEGRIDRKSFRRAMRKLSR